MTPNGNPIITLGIRKDLQKHAEIHNRVKEGFGKWQIDHNLGRALAIGYSMMRAGNEVADQELFGEMRQDAFFRQFIDA